MTRPLLRLVKDEHTAAASIPILPLFEHILETEKDPESQEPPLRKSGGGGTSDGMEPRIARLEAHMENVRAELQKLSAVPVQLAELKVRVDHLPTKGFIVASGMTTVAAITALLIFLQKLGVLH